MRPDNHITYEFCGKAALIGIDESEKGNVLSPGMFGALGRAADRAQREARAGVLFTHDGNFSASLDLTKLLGRDPIESMHSRPTSAPVAVSADDSEARGRGTKP
jgi:enoyl-CoA hydratase/carnithine racemase